ncbi:hypothetical protein QJQ45_006090 [Haematococcus lacustris]|nr:hypothetical protein QJQ45_006090 [Haematococcus lacustris]
MGVLANVVLRQGRAVGTLGHEEEMRRLRRQLIPKKAIARLEAGSHFGGAQPGQGASACSARPRAGFTAQVLGEGELQSSLRVLAATELELYHCHVEVFLRHASPALLGAMRDDVAFKLTYFYGRIGSISSDTVHEFGKYNNEVERALQYIQDLQSHFSMGAMDSIARARLAGPGAAQGVLPVPGYMEYLVAKGSTPAQSFWSQPAVSGTARSNAILPLLHQMYPEGLQPLAAKLDDLVARTSRLGQDLTALSPPRSPSRPLSAQHMDQGQERDYQRNDTEARPSASKTRRDRLTSADDERASCTTSPPMEPVLRPDRPLATSRPHSPTRPGALRAAGVMWLRGQEVSATPSLRQCLTFEEIARLKAEARRPTPGTHH